MLYFEALNLALQGYGLSSHKEDKFTKDVKKALCKRLGKIEKESDHEKKKELDQKVLDFSRSVVLYQQAVEKPSDLGYLLNNITLEYADEFTPFEYNPTLRKVLKRCRIDNSKMKDKLTIAIQAVKVLTSARFGLDHQKLLSELKIKDKKIFKIFEKIEAVMATPPLSIGYSPLKLQAVEIRVWTPDTKSVGHVSMLIRDGEVLKIPGKLYISLWPGDNIGDVDKLVCGVKGLNHTYSEDLLAEGHPETFKLTFLTLDIESMVEGYRRLTTLRWHICGADLGVVKKGKGLLSNCGSIVATLLVLGGIRDLFPENMRSDVLPATPTKEELWEMLKDVPPAPLYTHGNQVKENPYKYKSWSLEEPIAYVGKKIFKILDICGLRKQVIPSRFHEHLKGAVELDAKKCGYHAIVEFHKKEKSPRKRAEHLLKTFTGQNVPKILGTYEVKKNELNKTVNSAKERTKNFIAGLFNLEANQSVRNSILLGNIGKVFAKIKDHYELIVKECLQDLNKAKLIAEINQKFFEECEGIFIKTMTINEVETKKKVIKSANQSLHEDIFAAIEESRLKNQELYSPKKTKPSKGDEDYVKGESQDEKEDAQDLSYTTEEHFEYENCEKSTNNIPRSFEHNPTQQHPSYTQNPEQSGKINAQTHSPVNGASSASGNFEKSIPSQNNVASIESTKQRSFRVAQELNSKPVPQKIAQRNNVVTREIPREQSPPPVNEASLLRLRHVPPRASQQNDVVSKEIPREQSPPPVNEASSLRLRYVPPRASQQNDVVPKEIPREQSPPPVNEASSLRLRHVPPRASQQNDVVSKEIPREQSPPPVNEASSSRLKPASQSHYPATSVNSVKQSVQASSTKLNSSKQTSIKTSSQNYVKASEDLVGQKSQALDVALTDPKSKSQSMKIPQQHSTPITPKPLEQQSLSSSNSRNTIRTQPVEQQNLPNNSRSEQSNKTVRSQDPRSIRRTEETVSHVSKSALGLESSNPRTEAVTSLPKKPVPPLNSDVIQKANNLGSVSEANKSSRLPTRTQIPVSKVQDICKKFEKPPEENPQIVRRAILVRN